MTELKTPIKREFRSLSSRIRRPIIILIDPDGYIRLKEKGGRNWHSLSIELAYYLAIKNSSEEVNDKKRKTVRSVDLLNGCISPKEGAVGRLTPLRDVKGVNNE